MVNISHMLLGYSLQTFMHRSQVVGIGPSKAWFNCSFFKQAVRWYCLVVDDWLLPKGSLLVCFSHRDKAKLLVFYSHGWSKGMVALKVSWSAVSLYFNGFQLSRTNKWVFLVLAGGHGKDWTVGQPIGKRVVHS